jgi:hypothetical protein
MSTRNWLTVLALVAFPACAADIPDLGGVWTLNVEKSSWGKMQKPVSVVLEISHNQLTLDYSGVVTYSDEESREFSFTGAIDGNEYPMVRSYGAGKCKFRRLSLSAVESVFHTDNGLYTETSRMIVSRDGRTMTRYMYLKTPDGDRNWIEVYERR